LTGGENGCYGKTTLFNGAGGMKHTFILEEGVWLATGRYFDDAGKAVPIEGSARITHLKQFWLNESRMKLLLEDKPIGIVNDYEITPFEEGKESTEWKSSNPSLGHLYGQFVIVGDSILSICKSKNGTYRAMEYFLKVTAEHYRNRGAFFRDDQKVSSWEIELEKVEQGKHK
jgi:hypothetical protein